MIANPFASYNIEIPNMYKDNIHKYCQSSGNKNTVMYSPFERQVDLWFIAFLYAVNKKLTPEKVSDTYNATTAAILSSDPSRINTIQLSVLGLTKDIDYLKDPRRVFDYCLGLANAGIPYVIQALSDPEDSPLFSLTDLLESLSCKSQEAI